jgi:hypothetical protein
MTATNATPYEVWDGASGNCLGAYATEEDALAAIRADLRALGETAIRDIGLLYRPTTTEAQLIAAGDDLLRLLLHAVA